MMIDSVFDLCVQLLEWLAQLSGTSYKAINVWVFCVALPLVLGAMLVIIARQQIKIRNLSTTPHSPALRGERVVLKWALRLLIGVFVTVGLALAFAVYWMVSMQDWIDRTDPFQDRQRRTTGSRAQPDILRTEIRSQADIQLALLPLSARLINNTSFANA